MWLQAGVDVPTRRLRVLTRRLDVARSFTQLYASIHTPVLITQLTHKLIHASLEQGLGEARLLAKGIALHCSSNSLAARSFTPFSSSLVRADWLVNFTVSIPLISSLLFRGLTYPHLCILSLLGVLQSAHFGQ
jgi:hypothetical protein